MANDEDYPTGPRLLPSVLNTVAALTLAIGAVLVPLTEPQPDAPTAAWFGQSDSLLSLDPRAFTIWWAVAGVLSVFVVWQWTPRGRRSLRLASIGFPAIVGGLAQLAWVLLARAGLVVPTVALLVVETGALALVAWRLTKYRASWVEHLATDPGWGLALGLGCVQLLLGVGVVLDTLEPVDDDLHLVIVIAGLALFVAGALGLAGRLYRQFAVGVGLVWGLAWLGWTRLVGEPRNLLLGLLAGLGCFIIAAGFYASGARRRARVEGLEGAPLS
ncbi:MAG: hypothetical protein WBL05_01195 [Brooklawnia sp.]|uniref:hypothetical protein n=1 Tax=Brooklawnia sp. TaxID=2699740 RepID=UPI003C726022